MKLFIKILLAAVAFASVIPSTASAATYWEDVPVVSVSAVYDRQCVDRPGGWNGSTHGSVYDQEQAPRSRTAPIVGAIVGGALGNQVGDGSGRDAATVAGAALGYAITRDAQERNRYNERQYSERRPSYAYTECPRTVREYHVTIRTRYGLEDVTLPYHPGSTVRLRIETFVEG
jgi:uncharacterized protein YcfJ